MLADGMPVLWIARALGARSADRVTGIDLMSELLRVAGRERLRLYFLGASSDVLGALIKKVGDENAGAVIVGARDGYFAPEESPAIVDEIRASRADILFVGMPSPFKEVWCHDNLERLGTPVILPVGGAFDVLSGFIRRAPGRCRSAVWNGSGTAHGPQEEVADLPRDESRLPCPGRPGIAAPAGSWVPDPTTHARAVRSRFAGRTVTGRNNARPLDVSDQIR